METKEELRRNIANIDANIYDLNNRIKMLEEEKLKLKKLIFEIEKIDATKELLNSISNVTQENSMRVRLYSDTRTTPIMDDFTNSDKSFLIFENAFTVSSRWVRVSIVVAKIKNKIQYISSGLTMTNLKQNIGKVVLKSNLQYYEGTRLYPLYSELAKLENNSLVDGSKIPFSSPCILGGQTYSDQTGFGSEYCGEDLIYQGKEYGETTKFLIIGAIVD